MREMIIRAVTVPEVVIRVEAVTQQAVEGVTKRAPEAVTEQAVEGVTKRAAEAVTERAVEAATGRAVEGGGRLQPLRSPMEGAPLGMRMRPIRQATTL